MEQQTKGTLYVCATPIGNLEDMTFRAIRVLKEADLIAAEDTRNSIKLLNHFDIHTPMTSYHEHNKYDKAEELLEKLENGVRIALITDAGTPAISDPGEVLVSLAISRGIKVTPIPGACAGIAALVVSGQETGSFLFEGFLPKEKKKRREKLETLRHEPRTIILHAAPHHLRTTLDELLGVLGDRSVTLCRELTKLHEEVVKTTLADAIFYYEDHEPLGEYVLVLSGAAETNRLPDEATLPLSKEDIPEQVATYEAQGIPRKEAMRLVAKEYGISRRDVYQSLLNS